jgi:glyoxylase-like metal-dependent hydrolase (beta-lactamase superfamily II)
MGRIIFIFMLSPMTITQLSGQPPETIEHPWFKLMKINENVWRISDRDIDNIYLITGRDSALLIDSGIGAANLARFVKSITNLPLIIVNTHSHPDHSGSNHQFSKVHAHPDDFNMLRFFGTKAMRTGTDKAMDRNPLPDSLIFNVTDTLYYPKLAPVKEGHRFNLGGREIEVIHVPGHTPGSICLLDRKDKSLYTGDNDNTLVWLHSQDALPLETYLQSLNKLRQRRNEFTTLYPAHGDPIDKEFIDEQIACAQQIIAGKCEGKPYDSSVGKGLVCGFKRAQIVYDPAKIKVKR